MIAKFAASFFFMDDRHFGFLIKFLKRTLPLTSGPIGILGRSLQSEVMRIRGRKVPTMGHSEPAPTGTE
jgi:hypothetical protein